MHSQTRQPLLLTASFLLLSAACGATNTQGTDPNGVHPGGNPPPIATVDGGANESTDAGGDATAPSDATASSDAPATSDSGDADVGPAAGDGSVANGATHPSDIFDLRLWKLTLPVSSLPSGACDTMDGNACAIVWPHLQTFEFGPFFALNAAKSGVRFQANCDGVTTGGTGYPRSELREMADQNGTLASWSPKVGSHSMMVKEAVTGLPPTKPQTVAAQIHDDSADIIEILADGLGAKGRNLISNASGAITSGVISLCFRYKGVEQSPCLDDAYTIGTPYTLELVAKNSAIEIHYNGVMKWSQPDTGSGYYFKVGDYTQSSSSGKGGDSAATYGQTVVESVTVQHL